MKRKIEPSKVSVAFPALRQLGLSAEHLAALARQGFVTVENRGGSRPVHRLRFRFAGKQVVKYLRSDSGFIESVFNELRDLQAERLRGRELRRLTKEAGALLRSTKQAMLPIIAAQGLGFHGYELRRRGASSANEAVS